MNINQFPGSAPPPKGLPAIVKELEQIRREMHKGTDGSHGLLTFNIDRRKNTRRNERWIWVDRAERVRKEKGNLAWVRYMGKRSLKRRGWNR